jgi:predicted NAD/FAD-dependent oxidoreductase
MVEACTKQQKSSATFDLRQDVWVAPSNGARFDTKKRQWKLQAKGSPVRGYYDCIVIAHNGKCADRLMRTSPAKRVHELLRVNFASSVPPVAKHMTLNSIYSWTFAISKKTQKASSISMLTKALGEGFACGFVENSRDLRFFSCQTRKLRQEHDDDDYEVWTVLSSPGFAKQYKAPQEALGDETIETVTSLLSKALQDYLQLPYAPLDDIVEQRLQLWGAALPLNIWNNQKGFVYDGEFGVGVCGDWLLDASIAGAWTSGRLLAQHLLLSRSNDSDPTAVGLDGAFERSQAASKAGIGALEDAASSSRSQRAPVQ